MALKSPAADPLLRDLEQIAERRRALERERAREMEATAKLLRRGRRRGVPILHLAQAAGLTRQTVYDLTRGDQQ